MELRPLRWSDFDSFAEAYFARYDEITENPDLGIYLYPTKPTLTEEATFFARIMGDIVAGDAVCQVAISEGRVVGSASVHRKGKHLEDAHIGVLGIALLPAWRGKGLGSQLLHSVLDACRGRFELIQLAVLALNEPALRLYRKYGFEEYGRSPRSFKRGDRYLDDVLMWRPVGASP